MRRMLLAFSLMFWVLASIAADEVPLPMSDIREAFQQSLVDASATSRLLEQLNAQPNLDPVKTAYKGAALALQAKHHWNPVKKWEYVQEAMRLLNFAVEQVPFDLEVRYLRFLIEHHLPVFLGMSEHLDEDRQFIKGSMARLSDQAANHYPTQSIAAFFLTNIVCTEAEKAIFMPFM